MATVRMDGYCYESRCLWAQLNVGVVVAVGNVAAKSPFSDGIEINGRGLWLLKYL